MGGYYSTRWNGHIRKCPVESCLTFDLKTVPIAEYMSAAESHARDYNWTYTRDKKPAGNMGIVYQPEKMRLVFVYTATNDNGAERIEEPIRISTTPLNFGGVRYWLHCPHCGKRTRTLHKPPACSRFRCRACWGLTYSSVQTAHEWDRGAFVSLRVALDTSERLNELYTKIRKTRGDSKQRRRLQRKINQLESLWQQQMAQQEAKQTATRKRIASALATIDPEAAREFLAGDDKL
jgi:hypothetical protein